MSSVYKNKVRELRELLHSEIINLNNLRQLCFRGIPDEESLRPISWRVLLGYLPLDRVLWDDLLRKQRQTYASLVQDIVIERFCASVDGEKMNDDHPLSTNPCSPWSMYFKDNETLLQIDKDVRRLCPEISFFQQATEFPLEDVASGKFERLSKRVAKNMLESEIMTKDRSGALNIMRKCAQEQYKCLQNSEAHWEVVERILFIFSKLNPGVSYVQGMNEVVGPIYYVFASDSRPDWKAHAEADAFYCFQNLMSEIKDNFISHLDESSCGIDRLMTRFYELLKAKDLELYQQLNENQDILPQFYAFRWISLLLSQEFLLPEVIRIWDSLFSDSRRFAFLLYVSLAMLINVRTELLNGDFISNMKLLQNYPPTDPNLIISKAVELQES